MRRRTSFAPTVLLGLAGAALATVAATRPWAEATTRETGLRTVQAGGADVAPLALPLALVALAAWGTVLVLRRRGRRVVAVLGLAAALGGAAATVATAGTAPEVASRLLGAADGATTTTAWPVAAVVGCLLSAAASVVVVVKARGWPEMSARYDAPAAASSDDTAAAATPVDMWKAMDAGHDPTA